MKLPTPLEIFEQLSPLKDQPEEFEKAARKVIDDWLDTLPQEKIIKYQKFQQGLEDEMKIISDPLVRAQHLLVAACRTFGDSIDVVKNYSLRKLEELHG